VSIFFTAVFLTFDTLITPVLGNVYASFGFLHFSSFSSKDLVRDRRTDGQTNGQTIFVL